MKGRVFIGIAFVLAGFVVPQKCAAADRRLADDVAQFLEAGWNPVTARHEALAAEVDQLKQLAPGDGRIVYAFALVELKNRRYDEASRLLGEVLAVNKDDLSARRARVWLLMLTKRYSAALVEMELLAKSLPAGNGEGADEQNYRELVAFLGRMFAFLEGPMAGAVVDHVLTDARDHVTAQLNPQRRVVFDKANRALIRRFATLDLNREAKQDDAKTADQRNLDRVRGGIDRQRRQLADEQKTLNTQADKLRADLKTDLTAIDAELQPLDARSAQLTASATSLGRHGRALQAQIGLWLFQADHSPDPAEQADLRSQAAQMQGDLAAVYSDLRAVNAQRADIDGRRGTLIADRRTVLDQNRIRFASINRRTAEIAVTDRRLSTDLKTIPADATGNTAKVRALAAQATALTTYDDFPFDSERQRLLESFGN
jgi:hypothetical protein